MLCSDARGRLRSGGRRHRSPPRPRIPSDDDGLASPCRHRRGDCGNGTLGAITGRASTASAISAGSARGSRGSRGSRCSRARCGSRGSRGLTRFTLRRSIGVPPLLPSPRTLRLSGALLRLAARAIGAPVTAIVAALIAAAAGVARFFPPGPSPPRRASPRGRSRSSPLRLSRRPSRLRSDARSSRCFRRAHQPPFQVSHGTIRSTRESQLPLVAGAAAGVSGMGLSVSHRQRRG